MKRFVVTLCLSGLTLFASVRDCSAGLIVGAEKHNSSIYAKAQITGPLVEGALSYLDRSYHCYREIPEALVGADYIQVANNDKLSPFYTLDITLSQAATLYLFIDHRIGHGWVGPTQAILEPDLYAGNMPWVYAMGFIDTGWKMGMDEDDDGLSNQHFSIFSRTAGPGTITFYQLYDPTSVGDRNMYSVAAVVPEPISVVLLAAGSGFALRRKRNSTI